MTAANPTRPGPVLISVLAASALAFSGHHAARAQVPPKGPYVHGQVGSKPAGGTADHGKFEVLNRDFKSGPEVTKACLGCHTEAASQVMGTLHWSWDYTNRRTGQRLGKKNVINDFCASVTSNEPRCTSCHAGYGWKDATFDFANGENVDCLICHDRSATYWKNPTGAGHPPYTPVMQGGRQLGAVPNLSQAARSVGLPGRENCGACHFHGGGGDGVKHGSLDSSLLAPNRELDVHMDAKGLNFACTACHVTQKHVWAGSRYDVHATDPKGQPRPGQRRDVATCESCHGLRPHKGWNLTDVTLNTHVEKLACQTCHVPAFARGGVPTKMRWDWSTSGRLRDGKPFQIRDEKGRPIYESIKGDYVLAENVTPQYFWFDGEIIYQNAERVFDPARQPVPINPISGTPGDPKSRIWPFKVMTGKQPYDSVQNHFVYLHVFGPTDAAYWRGFNWDKSISAGMAAMGLPWSGKFDFVETVMYWPQTHMVAPREKAVKCGECHRTDGRLAKLAGFYMPGRDSARWVDILGVGLIGLVTAGVVGHALMRLMYRFRRRETPT